jgi:hypothetical protein
MYIQSIEGINNCANIVIIAAILLFYIYKHCVNLSAYLVVPLKGPIAIFASEQSRSTGERLGAKKHSKKISRLVGIGEQI